MIGHLELAIGTLMSHASWVSLIKICREVRFFSDASEQILIWLWTNLSRSDWSDFWLWTQPSSVCLSQWGWGGWVEGVVKG